jgi:hypothetical protein
MIWSGTSPQTNQIIYNSIMQQKRLSESDTSFKQRIIAVLAFLLCAVPLLSGRPLANRILLSAGALAVYALSLLFWAHFLPFQHDGDTVTFPFFRILLGNLLRRGRSIQTVKNGAFDADYFALRSKPAIPALLIDSHSAVTTKAANGKRGLLLAGLWPLERKTTVVHVFHLLPAAFTFGPGGNHNPFTHTISAKNNLRGGKALHMEIERTRCQTADGVELIPVFNVIYRIKPPQEMENGTREWLAFSAYLESVNVFGHVTDQIEDMIGGTIANPIKQTIASKTWDQIEQGASSREKLIAYIQRMLDLPADDSDGYGQNHLLPTAWRNIFTISVTVEQVWTR